MKGCQELKAGIESLSIEVMLSNFPDLSTAGFNPSKEVEIRNGNQNSWQSIDLKDFS